MDLKQLLNDDRTKHAFGRKSNILQALEERKIDAYDVLFLDTGEIAWIDEQGNVVISQSKTQVPFEINGISYDEGKNLDEVVSILSNVIGEVNNSNSPTYFMERELFPLPGNENALYVATDEDTIYRYKDALKMYLPLSNGSSSSSDGIQWKTL